MDVLRPDNLLHFIETTEFTEAWAELGLNDEGDLAALQWSLMAGPKRAPVIRGTGGLRKTRFVPPHARVGKSGGLRVCYVYFESYGIVLLVLVYAKTEKDDLSLDECKAIKRYIEVAEKELHRLRSLHSPEDS